MHKLRGVPPSDRSWTISSRGDGTLCSGGYQGVVVTNYTVDLSWPVDQRCRCWKLFEFESTMPLKKKACCLGECFMNMKLRLFFCTVFLRPPLWVTIAL